MDIKRVMKQYGFTVYTLAEKMNVKQPTLSGNINGNPTAQKLQDLADAIGCQRWEFFLDEMEASGFKPVRTGQPSAGSERSAGSEGQLPSEGREREQGAEGLPFGNEEKEHTAHRPTALGMYACPYCGRGVTIEVKGV